MVKQRIRASSSKSAKRKGTNKRYVVTDVNYIEGTKKGRMKTYSVTKRKRSK